MVGSLQDSEDAFQDTLLRAWRSLDSLADDRLLRRWLFRIATNVCLTALRNAQRRALPADIGPNVIGGGDHDFSPAIGASWIGPFPDQLVDTESQDPAARYEAREAIELAFIAALQHLPPRQRAALVLADVLGFKAAEVAELLETSVTAVNSALQRARERLRDRMPERSQQMVSRALGPSRLSEIAAEFVAAFEAGDEKAILELLSEDVSFEMPPYEPWSQGRQAVAESWLMPSSKPPGIRLVRTSVNGQLAFGVYSLERGGSKYLPAALDVIALDGDRVSAIVAFRSAEAFERFGLPESLES